MIPAEGVIVDKLPNAVFRVRLNNTEHEVIAQLSGKIRKNSIRVLLGDRVTIEMSPYDLLKGPDLVLIQLKLPVVSGFTAIRRMRRCAALREVPIIAVSFNNPTANRNVALAAGCNAHIEDPIEFDLLDELIDRLLPGERLPLASILIQ